MISFFAPKKTVQEKGKQTPSPHIYSNSENKTSNARFRGEIIQNLVSFPKELGEEHPFDFEKTEGMYKKYGFFFAAVNKYVDFLMGGGVYVVSESERALKIIEDFNKDVGFDSVLRNWFKEALIKGTGFLELGGGKNEAVKGLKVLDAKYMFIKRDEKGKIQKYNQYLSKTTGTYRPATITSFEPFQIACLTINKVGDCPYGLGLLQPGMLAANNLLGAQKEMHMLLERKANAPLHVKIGSYEFNDFPSAADIDSVGQELEWMRNDHEWVTGPNMEIKVVDFGNLSEQFMPAFEHYKEELFASVQVPHVLMGKANVAEGLASTQMDAFERSISSLKAEAEKIIEEEIYRRVLFANGISAHVEFEWGQPSSSEKKEKLSTLQAFLSNPVLHSQLRFQIEQEVARLLGLNPELLETPEEQREKEELQPNPKVPGQNGQKGHVHSEESGEITINEWLGFNYSNYQRNILSFLDTYNFAELQGVTRNQLLSGKLSTYQVNALRKVLQDGFDKGKSIVDIEKEVSENVNPGALYKMDGDEIVKDSNGEYVLSVGKEARSNLITRSEVTRAANAGALTTYKEGGVKNVQFIASIGLRTCPECSDLNGKIFGLSEAQNMIPVHSNCRCSWGAVTALD